VGTKAADADSVLGDELATQAGALLLAVRRSVWDSAVPWRSPSPAAVHASRADGRPLRYNQPNPWSPDLLVCRPEASARMVTLITRHGQGILR